MARKSLSEMDLAAIDGQDKPIAPPPVAAVRRPVRQRAAHKATAETTRLGISMSPAGFHDARAAYMWASGRRGAVRSLGEWIADALRQHADKSAKSRARIGRGLPEDTVAKGEKRLTRTFSVPVDLIEVIDDAILDDQNEAQRWMSRSAWANEAIRVATERVREQAGGTLPEPPARLHGRAPR